MNYKKMCEFTDVGSFETVETTPPNSDKNISRNTANIQYRCFDHINIDNLLKFLRQRENYLISGVNIIVQMTEHTCNSPLKAHLEYFLNYLKYEYEKITKESFCFHKHECQKLSLFYKHNSKSFRQL